MTENIEHTSLTTSASPQDEAILPPHPKEKKRQLRSDMWNHFTMVEGDEKKARCQYCGVLIKYSNGTSGMRTHLGRCTAYDLDKTQGTQPTKRRKTTSEGQVVCSPSYSKFDQEEYRALLVKTFVCAELPFRFVENEMFRKLLITLQPRFFIPLRSTLRRDIWALYLEEKEKLKKFLSNCGRVCLTTDTWTSTQNLSYMSLTVHFVDSEGKMHKKIINFCQITGHSGHLIGKYVDDYLRSWGLSQILTITVDNASTNTTMIKYLNIRMGSWSNLVLNGEFVHTRCCTHILNLIVKSGLKEDKSCIKKILHAVKYVKSSPSRLAKFMECVVQEKVTYKGVVILDVETRWNSTYSMLKAALQYQKAFDLLYARDKTFREEMDTTNHGVKKEDWTYVASVLPLLEMFYKSTIPLSGSLYVTSASYMAEVFTIGMGINKHLKSNNEHIKNTVNKRKGKFNKYWGNPDTINILLLIAFVL